ncbi:MAG: hypothetical protein ACOY3D_05885 [Candidatus Omnitrophota bacterium]
MPKKKRPLKKRTAGKRKSVRKAAKRPVRKPVKKPRPAPKPKTPPPIGKVTHYFPHVQAGVIKLKSPLSAGDTITVKGHTTNFTQVVESMQIDHVPITTAKKGAEIGLKVTSRVRHGDLVYKS